MRSNAKIWVILSGVSFGMLLVSCQSRSKFDIDQKAATAEGDVSSPTQAQELQAKEMREDPHGPMIRQYVLNRDEHSEMIGDGLQLKIPSIPMRVSKYIMTKLDESHFLLAYEVCLRKLTEEDVTAEDGTQANSVPTDLPTAFLPEQGWPIDSSGNYVPDLPAKESCDLSQRTQVRRQIQLRVAQFADPGKREKDDEQIVEIAPYGTPENLKPDPTAAALDLRLKYPDETSSTLLKVEYEYILESGLKGWRWVGFEMIHPSRFADEMGKPHFDGQHDFSGTMPDWWQPYHSRELDENFGEVKVLALQKIGKPIDETTIQILSLTPDAFVFAYLDEKSVLRYLTLSGFRTEEFDRSPATSEKLNWIQKILRFRF